MGQEEALREAFAAELKARRARLKLSQEELAHRAEVNRTYVAKLELAKNTPTLWVAYRLACAIEVELPVLLHATLERFSRKPPDAADRGHNSRIAPRPTGNEGAVKAMGLTPDDWGLLKQRARQVLIGRARSPAKSRKRLITWAELVDELEMVRHLDRDDHRLFRLVAEISEDEVTAGRPMLGAIVAKTHSGQIGQAPDCDFNAVARLLGKDTRQPDCWLRELGEVYAYWNSHPDEQ